jgi:hypothetical protein
MILCSILSAISIAVVIFLDQILTKKEYPNQSFINYFIAVGAGSCLSAIIAILPFKWFHIKVNYLIISILFITIWWFANNLGLKKENSPNGQRVGLFLGIILFYLLLNKII